MAGSFWVGFAILLVSGVLNASFPLPMKYARGWKWENTWLAFTTLGLFVLPAALAAAAVPDIAGLYRSLPAVAFAPAAVFGFLWGTAQVTFGLSFQLVGMAMAFAIVLGMSGLGGSFITMAVLHPEDFAGPRGAALALAGAILTTGLVLYAKAGRARERDAGVAVGTASARFRKGLAICLYTGLTGGFINLGFAFSGTMAERAAERGASPLGKDLAVWAVVLGAGYVPNLLYTTWLLARNGTASRFAVMPGREAAIATATAVLWLSGTLGYGAGATTMGTYGTSVGYAVYITVLLLWSSTLGVLTGEWRRAAPRTVRQMRTAVGVILAALIVLVASQ